MGFLSEPSVAAWIVITLQAAIIALLGVVAWYGWKIRKKLDSIADEASPVAVAASVAEFDFDEIDIPSPEDDLTTERGSIPSHSDVLLRSRAMMQTRASTDLGTVHNAPALLGVIVDRTVGLLFATNRKSSGQGQTPAFSDERTKQLCFGALAVRVPEGHEFGKIEHPWEASLFGWTIYRQEEDDTKHFTIKSRQQFSRAAFVDVIAASGADDAVVFVHGFNTGFDDAAYRLAQIAYDTQFPGLPILFSWPSKGKILSYPYDRESTDLSIDPFMDLLQLLENSTGLSKIHVIAHSMGNQIVARALERHGGTLARPLNEIILAAPDVARDTFTDIAGRIRAAAGGVTLYASSNDKALVASRELWEMVRAGDVPSEGPLVIHGIDTIDVSAVGEEIFGLNHNTFAAEAPLINDIGRLLTASARPPNIRTAQIRCVPDSATPPDYWRYVR